MIPVFLVLLLFYAVAFVIVVWPMHWFWHSRTRQGPYDKRFYRQASFWRMYFCVFGTALLISLVLNLLHLGPA